MKTGKTTRTFKSGNSIAVRLPKALGIEAGVEMRVREERGKYVLEPVEESRRRSILRVSTARYPISSRCGPRSASWSRAISTGRESS